MRYVIRTLLGMGLFAFCWAATAIILFFVAAFIYTTRG
jgi:hypothetical protein